MSTPNKALNTPANGADVGSWDVPVNANWNSIDTAFGGLTTLNVTSQSGTVALTSTQYTPANVVVTGTLTANVTYQLPSGVGAFFFVENATSGAFSVSFSSASGGATVTVPQGSGATVVIDPTNGARLADTIPAGAGGSAGEVQYNNTGVLAGSGGLTYNSGSQALTVGGALSVGGNLSVAGSLVSDLTVTGGAQTTSVGVTFSATAMVVNCALSNVFRTTLTANVTTAPALNNPGDAQTINWYITQDGTGNRTMTWPSSFKWSGGTAGVLSTSANAVDLLSATYLSATGNWYAVLAKNFS